MAREPTTPDTLRILVLDDDAAIRREVSAIVREIGHTPVEVGDAERALEIQRVTRCEVLVVDWMLPGMSGLEFVRELRSRPRGQSPVVLMGTARTRPDDFDEALRAGADDIIGKPWEPLQLYARLRFAAHTALVRRMSDRQASALSGADHDIEVMAELFPEPVAIVGLDTGIEWANSALHKALGQVEGRRLVDLVHPDDRADLEGICHGKLVSNRVLRFPRKGRKEALIEIEPGGQLEVSNGTRRFVMLRDVTKKRLIEDQLLLTDRLTTMGTMAASVAHEINNPLGYLLANLEFVREVWSEHASEIGGEDAEEVDAALVEAKEGAERVATIVKDLNRFSRAEEDLAPTDPNRVARTAAQIVRAQYKHKKQLVEEFTPVPIIEAAEGRLVQVLVNLLTNAAHALEGVEEPTVWLRSRSERGHVVFEVEDNGHGIPPRVRGKIFTPFFTTKPVGQGTGLGLAICHSVAVSHGGTIEYFEGKLGGAGFRLTLPTAVPAGAPKMLETIAPAAVVTPPAGGRAKVLVFDEDVLVGRAIRRALLEHDVHIVNSASTAREVLAQHEFGLVLLDVSSIDGPGIQIYRHLEVEYPELAASALLLSCGVTSATLRDWFESVPNRSLDKPFGLAMLRALVSAQLDTHALRDIVG